MSSSIMATPRTILRERRPMLSAGCETFLLALGFLAQWFLLPHTLGADGEVRYRAISDLLAHGTVFNTKYSLIGPLVSAPLWYLGQLLLSSDWWLARFNLVLLASGIALMYALLKDTVDRRLLRAFFLLLLAASAFPAHIEYYYGEVFTALCVGVGLLAAIMGRRARWGGWLAVAIGVANTPATLLGLLLVAGKQALDNRRLRFLLVVVASGALIATEAWIVRGSPFANGYGDDKGYRTFMPYSGLSGFSYPFFIGLLSILLSFGKGLFFYTPGLLLPTRRMLRALSPTLARVHQLWLYFVLGLTLVYANWWAWYGGWFWGPRFFLFASLPASLALAVWLRQRDAAPLARVAVLLTLALSCWVGIDGAVFSQNTLEQTCLWNNFALESVCHYIPEFSPLWRPFVIAGQVGIGPQFFQMEQLDTGKLLYALYTLLVFLYFAIPLLIALAQQIAAAARQFARERFAPGGWRF